MPWFSVQWSGLLYCNLADEKCKEWWCSNISFMLFPIAAEEEELRRYVVHKSDNAALLSPRTLSLHSNMLKSSNWHENRVFFCTFICCWLFTLCHIAYLLLLKIFMFIWCLTCVVIVKESGFQFSCTSYQFIPFLCFRSLSWLKLFWNVILWCLFLSLRKQTSCYWTNDTTDCRCISY